jgi:hypothetical protein
MTTSQLEGVGRISGDDQGPKAKPLRPAAGSASQDPDGAPVRPPGREQGAVAAWSPASTRYLFLFEEAA